MSLADCPHKRPPCPVTATRWQCQKRSEAENLVLRGGLARESAESLLRKYNIPITPASATEIYNQKQRMNGKLL